MFVYLFVAYLLPCFSDSKEWEYCVSWTLANMLPEDLLQADATNVGVVFYYEKQCE